MTMMPDEHTAQPSLPEREVEWLRGMIDVHAVRLDDADVELEKLEGRMVELELAVTRLSAQLSAMRGSMASEGDVTDMFGKE